ncbi:MAG TPA: hypothetical protein VH988_19225 [Thermoanaerobaculia bacterium]|nr:hypothetical protein [Thermoanaerobaculia bacterium]
MELPLETLHLKLVVDLIEAAHVHSAPEAARLGLNLEPGPLQLIHALRQDLDQLRSHGTGVRAHREDANAIAKALWFLIGHNYLATIVRARDLRAPDLGAEVSPRVLDGLELGAEAPDLEARPSDLEARLPPLKARLSDLGARPPRLEANRPHLGSKLPDLKASLPDLEAERPDHDRSGFRLAVV